MYMIYEIIKLFLFKIKLLKPTSIEDKFLFLINKNINIYNLKNHLDINFINKNIKDSIEHIEIILNKDFSNEYIYELNLQNRKTYKLSLYRWCSDNDRYIENIELLFNKWLVLNRELYRIYKEGIKTVGSGKLYSNSVKIKPFIKQVKLIIDLVLAEVYPR